MTDRISIALDALKGQSILVTGGTGMIGANLVHRMVDSGVRPAVAKRTGSDLSRLINVADGIETVDMDLTDSHSTMNAVAAIRPDIIFHLAGSFFNPPTLTAVEHMMANAIGTLHLLDAAVNHGKPKIVYSGSASVYAGAACLSENSPLAPGTAFGASKAAATLLGATYAKMHGLPFVELRVFSAFGPWERKERLIPYTIHRALDGMAVDIGHGEQQRDFVYVDDIVDAFLLAAVTDLAPGEIINLSSGHGYAIRDVAERLLKLMGDPVPLHVGARDTRKDEIWEISGDTEKARRLLGWEVSTLLDDGLRATFDWIRENRDLANAVK